MEELMSKPPINPKVRANVYALAALYLLYLFYQIAKPFLTRDPYGPTALQFGLGLVVLGGGAAALGFLAWRMYKVPCSEKPEEDGGETNALPEDTGEGEDDG